jgi:hypothetical protein
MIDVVPVGTGRPAPAEAMVRVVSGPERELVRQEGTEEGQR